MWNNPKNSAEKNIRTTGRKIPVLSGRFIFVTPNFFVFAVKKLGDISVPLIIHRWAGDDLTYLKLGAFWIVRVVHHYIKCTLYIITLLTYIVFVVIQYIETFKIQSPFMAIIVQFCTNWSCYGLSVQVILNTENLLFTRSKLFLGIQKMSDSWWLIFFLHTLGSH